MILFHLISLLFPDGSCDPVRNDGFSSAVTVGVFVLWGGLFSDYYLHTFRYALGAIKQGSDCVNLKCLLSTLTQLDFAGSAELCHLSQSTTCFLPLWVDVLVLVSVDTTKRTFSGFDISSPKERRN